MARAVVLETAERATITVQGFGAAFTRHALGRVIDRSGGRVDPMDAMRDGHDAVMRLGMDVGEQVLALPRLIVPTRGGAFLGAPRAGSIRFVAATWVGTDQLHDDQEIGITRWRTLLGLPT